MTQEEKCSKCGKRVRQFKAATITQWLKSTSDCSCDSENQLVTPPSQEYEQIIRCETCGKDRSPAREGSLTQWIFKENRCKCDWNPDASFESKPPAGNYRPEPIDEETKEVARAKEIDYHGLSKDAFPFERYRIVNELGRGSSGIVYKCWDTFLKKRVAIKTLHGRVWSAEDLLRLQNEARAASKLGHPGVVRVLDFGATGGGQPFMVMDFVQGQTLQDVLTEQNALDQYTALCLFSQILAAVGHAHRHGVLHRDIKPSNILVVDALSEHPQARVIDFGIAALTHAASATTTASGNRVVTGSPSYMSPDQAHGEVFEETSDIYSLGCVFYEMLTGVNPFRAETVLDTISRHATLEPPPFSETAPEAKVDQALEPIVAKMLEKSPHLRYQSVDEVRQPIEEIFERQVLARGGSSLRKRRGSIDQDLLLNDRSWKTGRSPDLWLYAIAGSSALFVLSLVLLVMNRTAEDVLPNKAETAQTHSAPEQLDDEISKPSYIEDLLLPNSKKNDAYLKTLKPGPDLKEVNLRMSDITDDGVKSIERLPIISLDLSYTSVSDKAMEYVSHMPQLKALYLTGCNVTKYGIAKLRGMKTLEFIDLSAIPASVESMKTVASMPELRRLYLISVPGITAKCIDELEAAPCLAGLGLRRTLLDKNAVVAVSKLSKLESLLLSYCGLDDHDVQSIAGMRELHMLDLSGNSITDASLKTLATHKSLKVLYIGNCPNITNAGIAEFKRINGKCAVRAELGPNLLGANQN